jgi:DNA replicative helicase MCM subunit Mcm2 (Cdc46/Mcm family)
MIDKNQFEEEAHKYIHKMNMKTKIYEAELDYTHKIISKYLKSAIHVDMKNDIRSPTPPPKNKPKKIEDDMEEIYIDNETKEDKLKLKSFMEENYENQKRIPVAEIQKLYKQKKFLNISQKEMKEALELIGYKVSNCSHKLTAILDDGFR